MDIRSVLDRCEKFRLLQGFDPRTIQPVASRYTNYVIVAPGKEYLTFNRKGES